jgi:hypothetical protein
MAGSLGVFEPHAINPVRLRRIGFIGRLLFEHDLFEKPVTTFSDHAVPFQQDLRKACSGLRHMVSNWHVIPETSD